MTTEKQIYQIQITLKDSNPRIWRRFLTSSDITLNELHKIIQTTMGWANSHLHQFEKGRDCYAPKSFNIEEAKDSKEVKLDSLLQNEKDKMKYTYDFGDDWELDIILEKILPLNTSNEIPLCIAGSRACPPDDCGGIAGYEELLEIISNPKHPDFDEKIEWLGENFDPEYFDMDEVNSMLKGKNFGCMTM